MEKDLNPESDKNVRRKTSNPHYVKHHLESEKDLLDLLAQCLPDIEKSSKLYLKAAIAEFFKDNKDGNVDELYKKLPQEEKLKLGQRILALFNPYLEVKDEINRSYIKQQVFSVIWRNGLYSHEPLVIEKAYSLFLESLNANLPVVINRIEVMVKSKEKKGFFDDLTAKYRALFKFFFR